MKLNIHVIIGKSLSGKSTLLNQLQKLGTHQVPKLITNTTRPKREHERNGHDYHFVTNTQYNQDIKQNIAIAPRAYNVAHHQTWYYYLSQTELSKHLYDPKINHVALILDYQGSKDLKAYINKFNNTHINDNITVTIWYLDVDIKTRLTRYLLGPRSNEDPKEVIRRLYDDEYHAFNDLDDPKIIEAEHIHKIHNLSDMLPTLLDK